MAALASRLADRQHEVTLFTLDAGQVERHAVSEQVKRERLDLLGESRWIWNRVWNTRKRIDAIRSSFLQHAPDVVLSFCDRTNVLVGLALKDTHIPFVLSERSDPSQQHLGKIGEWLRGRAYQHASRLIALTDTSADHLGNRFRVPVEVIASAVDTPPLQSDRLTACANRRILGIGRLEREKGFDRLIDAFANSCAENDWSLRILGQGSQQMALQSQAAKLGIENRVSFPGWASPIWEELAQATLFALPSRYEGFPSALLEAMVVGVPSIAVDCESGPRAVLADSIFQEQPGGLLVDNSTLGLAHGFSRLIQNEDFRETMGRTGKAALDRFGWTTLVDQYERVLQSVIAKD